MSDLLAACQELAAQGKAEELASGVYYIGTIDATSPEFQEFQRRYAEDFWRRVQKRDALEREAALKLWREGPWYF